ALMACRLIALDKKPGVRPIGIGEVFRRLFAKCVLRVCGSQAMALCGNFNLCAGLSAGMEGAIHALCQVWEAAGTDKAAAQPTTEADGNQADNNNSGQSDSRTAEADEARASGGDMEEHGEQEAQASAPTHSQVSTDPTAILLVDARNGFNELNRRAMLWTVRHTWAAGARFALNCYRHSAQLIVRRHGGESCHLLLSSEGVTQGDPLSMMLYGLALAPLSRQIREATPSVCQSWYADDSGMGGPASKIAQSMRLLARHGPERGYFPEPSKSIVVCREEDRAAVQDQLVEFGFQYTEGQRYLGGFIGKKERMEEWLTPQVDHWSRGVTTLAKVARRFPQTAYAGLTRSFQNEWAFVQRVTPSDDGDGSSGQAYAPIEGRIRSEFIPSLLGDDTAPSDVERRHYSLSVKQGGLGIPNPVHQAARNHAASVSCTEVLTTSLVRGVALPTTSHSDSVQEARGASKTATREREKLERQALIDEIPEKARLIKNASSTGAWLTTAPNAQNGTLLSAEEFRDNARLRFGKKLQFLPEKCDGCGAPFTLSHALTCKKGGLITIRHNDVCHEWQTLCKKAINPSAVRNEPQIHGCVTQAGDNADEQAKPELRGDASVWGFWKRGNMAIFDVRITDTNCPSNRKTEASKVLARHEAAKKKLYLEACLARRRSFTPLVFSVDGMMGTETNAAVKQLASLLSAKLSTPYSVTCGFVRSRLSMALARGTSLCLRGTRDPNDRRPALQLDNGAGLALHCETQ
ncbi:MAG: hypothetical protein AAF471_07510, partial [Myxococcota bacterium]